ncbi:MAG: bifunctional metallophosphatase/5'-nucleotidase [Hyphomicrobiaceae bacterium]
MERLFAALTVCLWTMTVASASAIANFEVSILHINDVHSRIEPINRFNSTCRPEDNAAGMCFGGMARLKTAIETRRQALRKAGRHVLTLDAGDQFQGSLFYSTYKGAVAVDLMNRIGFDAMAVGNHEFDDGPEKLAEFAGKAKFPLLFANTNLAKEPLLAGKIKSHIIKEFAGQKVAIIGILAEDTSETSTPGPNVPFIRSELILKKLIGQLEAGGINKIIVLSHVGISRDKEIASAVDGIDVIVGGHSHTLLKNYPTVVKAPNGKPVYIVQAYAYSKYLGELAVKFDDKGNVTAATGKLWQLDAIVREDPEVLTFIKQKAAPIQKLKTKVVGSASRGIDGSRQSCRARECAMGNLVADAILARVKKQGITIAIQNGGGLRASIDAGEITMGEVITVLPFQNTLATFQLKGADIIAALENGVSKIDEGAGRFPQVAGLRFVFDRNAAPGQRVSAVMVTNEAGELSPIDPDRVYGVVSNNYLRNGGDGYKVFATNAMNSYDHGPGLEQVVADYVSQLNKDYVPYIDGRIAAK